MIMNLPDVKTFPDNPVDVTTKQCRRHNQTVSTSQPNGHREANYSLNSFRCCKSLAQLASMSNSHRVRAKSVSFIVARNVIFASSSSTCHMTQPLTSIIPCEDLKTELWCQQKLQWKQS